MGMMEWEIILLPMIITIHLKCVFGKEMVVGLHIR